MPNQNKTIASLANYTLLGRSGLRVSPLCLGTMTFGTEWGWGSPEETAFAIFKSYIEVGGNFIDTADGYTEGRSEEMIGRFMREMGNRDQLVLATKYTFNNRPGDPNAGGNSRKNMMRAIDGSLKRLQTDYVDLYWLHAWDTLTPAEEVMYALDTLVRSGKVRYIALSDTPAWYLSRAQTLAELRGWERVCALQLEYSLVERNIEREHVPAALELGMGICSWSPLASGFLTGKYRKTGNGVEGAGRLQITKDWDNPVFHKFTERNWNVLETLDKVSTALGRPKAQVALNWITNRPGVASTIIGATKLEQLQDNLHSLDFEIPPQLSKQLDEASKLENVFPYMFFEPGMQAMITGGVPVRAEPRAYRPAR